MTASRAVPFPRAPEEFDGDWIEGVFNAPPGSLRSFDYAPVGTGQICDSFRFSCDWSAGDDTGPPPRTFIAKCPSTDARSRAAAALFHLYDMEVGWYRDCAVGSGVYCPKPYYAAISEDEQAFALLISDMAPAVQGDQLAGASLAELESALREAAALHAYQPAHTRLEEISWLRHGEQNSATLNTALAANYPAFRARFETRLDRDILDLGERLLARITRYTGYQSAFRCIAHGDLRLDNILFDARDTRACLVDWQTVHHGSAAADVAYLIGTSFAAPAVRAREEKNLVEGYLRRRAELGLRIDFDLFWTEYRRYAFSGFLMAVSASMTVQQTDRGDEMFALMAERPAIMALELDSLALL
jgi:hypothetical protein